MKYLVAALCSLFLAFPALAQDKKDAKKEASPAQKKQQERMKDCNDKAADKKGDDRKKFMSSCLKGEADSGSKQGKMTEQQSRMGKCNKDAGAKGLKGDDRKKFMSECLKG